LRGAVHSLKKETEKYTKVKSLVKTPHQQDSSFIPYTKIEKQINNCVKAFFNDLISIEYQSLVKYFKNSSFFRVTN
jgi:hypothetical protein